MKSYFKLDPYLILRVHGNKLKNFHLSKFKTRVKAVWSRKAEMRLLTEMMISLAVLNDFDYFFLQYLHQVSKCDFKKDMASLCVAVEETECFLRPISRELFSDSSGAI